MKHGLLLLLPMSFVIGCSSEDSATDTGTDTKGTTDAAAPSDDTAQAAVESLVAGIKDGNAEVAWDALPATYQDDINGLVQSFGQNMDPQVWTQVTTMLGSVQQVLENKGEFIANHPDLAQAGDSGVAKESISQVAGLLKALIDGGDLEKLKKFDGRDFMKTTGSSLIKQMDALQKLAPPGALEGPTGLASLDDVKVETVTSTADAATLKVTLADGTDKTEEYVKHEGKWLPKEMVDNWSEQMTKATAAVADLPNQADQMRGGVLFVSGMVTGALTPLQSAETQEQFNAGVDGIKAQLSSFGIGAPPAAFEESDIKESLNEISPETEAVPETIPEK